MEKIAELHEALEIANLPHAFGGALALAWCTQQARGTIDIDINIFVEGSRSHAVLTALPNEVTWSESDRIQMQKEGQIRVWWNSTPLDVFLNSTPFHEDLAQRIRWEFFDKKQMPFLSCLDLAVFKAFFNRTKDWADLEAMNAARTLNVGEVSRILQEYLGPEDIREKKLREIELMNPGKI